MSIITPRDLPTQDTSMRSGDLIEKHNPLSGQNESVAFEDINSEGIYLSSGRKAFQELTSGTLSASGWYTIAELDNAGFDQAVSRFNIVCANSSITIEAGIYTNSAIKNYSNTAIRIVSITGVLGTSNSIKGARIAKADGLSNTGAKLQVELTLSSPFPMSVNMIGNIGRPETAQKVWELVTPYLDNTPTLPDGVTAATFLEAGAELSFASDAVHLPIYGTIISNDAILCTIQWPEIPLQGSTLTLTDPSLGLLVTSIGVTLPAITGATISNFVIENKLISFRLNKVGAFAGYARESFSIRTNGTGGKLTLS